MDARRTSGQPSEPPDRRRGRPFHPHRTWHRRRPAVLGAHHLLPVHHALGSRPWRRTVGREPSAASPSASTRAITSRAERALAARPRRRPHATRVVACPIDDAALRRRATRATRATRAARATRRTRVRRTSASWSPMRPPCRPHDPFGRCNSPSRCNSRSRRNLLGEPFFCCAWCLGYSEMTNSHHALASSGTLRQQTRRSKPSKVRASRHRENRARFAGTELASSRTCTRRSIPRLASGSLTLPVDRSSRHGLASRGSESLRRHPMARSSINQQRDAPFSSASAVRATSAEAGGAR